MLRLEIVRPQLEFGVQSVAILKMDLRCSDVRN